MRADHDCRAFVGSNALLRKPARMRVALSATAGILSALAPLLIKETVFLLSGVSTGYLPHRDLSGT